MKIEIQRFDASDDEGTIHTIVELHEDLSGRTSYASVAHIELYIVFCTLSGELLYPLGNGNYKMVGTNKRLRRMRVLPPLHPPLLNQCGALSN